MGFLCCFVGIVCDSSAWGGERSSWDRISLRIPEKISKLFVFPTIPIQIALERFKVLSFSLITKFLTFSAFSFWRLTSFYLSDMFLSAYRGHDMKYVCHSLSLSLSVSVCADVELP